jgi:arsenic resistance protein ArsH
MRMFVIPNQSSLPKAWTQFTLEGRLMASDNRDRLVDVCEELVKVTAILFPHFESLGDRFSERKERRAHGKLRTQAEKENHVSTPTQG